MVIATRDKENRTFAVYSRRSPSGRSARKPTQRVRVFFTGVASTPRLRKHAAALLNVKNYKKVQKINNLHSTASSGRTEIPEKLTRFTYEPLLPSNCSLGGVAVQNVL